MKVHYGSIVTWNGTRPYGWIAPDTDDCDLFFTRAHWRRALTMGRMLDDYDRAHAAEYAAEAALLEARKQEEAAPWLELAARARQSQEALRNSLVRLLSALP
jgi:hypothetical protein